MGTSSTELLRTITQSIDQSTKQPTNQSIIQLNIQPIDDVEDD